ncbi:hypothetical protein XAC29_12905 [Xanthomonas axonopodis Xac29-1]|nr:hypothetical protein XAC29_12905 [Xanthomonas axonopodis Xac29-1]
MRGRRQRFQAGQCRRRQRARSRRRGRRCQRGTCTDRRGGRHALTQKGSTVHRCSLE